MLLHESKWSQFLAPLYLQVLDIFFVFGGLTELSVSEGKVLLSGQALKKTCCFTLHGQIYKEITLITFDMQLEVARPTLIRPR